MPSDAVRRPAWFRRLSIVAFLIGVGYALLLIPEPRPTIKPPRESNAFVWDKDDVWADLENRFNRVRAEGCAVNEPRIAAGLTELNERITRLEVLAAGRTRVAPGQIETAALMDGFFSLSAQIAACSEHTRLFMDMAERLRAIVKELSRDWDPRAKITRDTLYRVLYGMRAAIEEVLLQQPPLSSRDALSVRVAEPFATPAAIVHGVEVHSGDILVSRGGAPTSALIARGNDYPGNFSHIALVHVDVTTHTVSIIESHIERGVAISTVDAYLRDKKLRVLVLRLRADVPAIVRDPLLPHNAATKALDDVRKGHIPYDFEMDTRDPSKQFCSEVASAVYHRNNVELWRGLSTMSSRGLMHWLGSFGVTHFTTYAPADLEYDPQLRVVAEWRDPAALFQDHVDNAVIDALLESAERGAPLEHDPSKLPLVRIAKAYSMLLNLFGAVGPVPEGMSATVALRSQWLDTRHRAMKKDVLDQARAFRSKNGYTPPYWRLVDMARRATPATKPTSGPGW